MYSDVEVRLRVIEEVCREYGRSQIGKRVGKLSIAPAGFLSGLPGGVGDFSRSRSRFPDEVSQCVNFGVACCAAGTQSGDLLFAPAVHLGEPASDTDHVAIADA